MMRLVSVLLLVSEALAFQTPATRTTSRWMEISQNQQRSSSILQVSTLDALDAFYQNEPYVAAFVTCSVKASAADWVAQTQSSTTEEQTALSESKQPKETETSSLDFRRNLGFWLYGGLYSGMAQQYIYNTLFPAWFGTQQVTLASVAEQVLFDMAIVTPFLCLPIAYIVKESVAKAGAQSSLLEAIQKYMLHVQEEGLLFKYWAIWIPVQCLTFGVIPQHLRIPFIAAISFFWLIILSAISSIQEKPEAESST